MLNKFLSSLILLFLPLASLIAQENLIELPLEFEEETLIAADEPTPAPGFVAELDLGPIRDDDVDPRVLRDFIESRGNIECRQKCGKLVIAGDVRARWTAIGEKTEDLVFDTATQTRVIRIVKKRGAGTSTGINRFRSEMNLFLDYETPCSWSSTKLRWSVIDGRDGGSETKTDLDRAFIGYDIFNEGDQDFYVELGRSKLDYIFDSRLEFGSVFDGIHLYYTNNWPGIGNFVLHGGPFIIDARTNHYGWIVETFVSKWAGTGIVFKYSIIDWNRHNPTVYYGKPSGSPITATELKNNPRYKFIVSQMLFGYERKIDFLACKTLYLYGAVLTNHDAQRTRTTNYRKLNGAWYAGFTLGKLCKACDWSLDINYQSVQAQAIPEFDLSGIGHGNADGSFFYNAVVAGEAPFFGKGFSNYKGWQISLLYALTDTLSLRSKAEWSHPRNQSVGGYFRYKSFEFAAIFAF